MNIEDFFKQIQEIVQHQHFLLLFFEVLLLFLMV